MITIGYYTWPVNSADSTDFTGPEKTQFCVNPMWLVLFLFFHAITDITVVVSEKLLDLYSLSNHVVKWVVGNVWSVCQENLTMAPQLHLGIGASCTIKF